jgi:hypothetical protein
MNGQGAVQLESGDLRVHASEVSRNLKICGSLEFANGSHETLPRICGIEDLRVGGSCSS